MRFFRNIHACAYVYIFFVKKKHTSFIYAHCAYQIITTPPTAAIIHTGDACPMLQQLLAINSHLYPITQGLGLGFRETPTPRNPQTPYPQALKEIQRILDQKVPSEEGGREQSSMTGTVGQWLVVASPPLSLGCQGGFKVGYGS